MGLTGRVCVAVVAVGIVACSTSENSPASGASAGGRGSASRADAASPGGSLVGCSKDTDCKGTRVCIASECTSPDATGTGGDASGDGAPIGMGGRHDLDGSPMIRDSASLEASPGDASGKRARVVCGDRTCLDGNLCCVEFASISPTTTCESACPNGMPVRCDGPEDCSGGRRCCYENGVTGGSGPAKIDCEDQCLNKEIACGGPESCPSGQSCCGQPVPIVGAGIIVTHTWCATACVAPPLGVVLCRTGADCPSKKCLPSSGLPGFFECG